MSEAQGERGQPALPDLELLALDCIDHIERLSKFPLMFQVWSLEVGKGGLPPL